ncbi:carboxylesterase family protein [Aulographum hederae CBS 113979]|uniref:Carboxylic ester hydrolase n=1 Tax=Aulographum hederae CBS 113979 TaxID=1176131 RepID=A0A6G1HCS8_9PEZI|nr:carboxylesterase family protein [Aulographum hederae CBS 113979]
MVFLRSFYLQLLAVTSLATATVQSNSTVDLGYATYRGTPLEAGVTQFLGVRYAAPPVGERRWRAPQDPGVETGVQDAGAYKPICIGQSQPTNSTSLSEDCLHLNIFTPSNATASSKLPVWFYIQGGGFGTNYNANYNGTEVVRRSGNGLILVNFNYRVGALGFLASEEVHRDGDLNAGLLDQRKALEWVREYIHLFGGDPNRVVLHGSSAGGSSIAYHLQAYGGRNDNLFIGGIAASPYFPYQPTVGEAEFVFDRFASDVGCGNASNTLSCLRSANINAIEVANVPKPFPGAPGPGLFAFLPVVDGNFSRHRLYDAFSNGNFFQIPLIVGGDTNEGTVFAPNASSPADVSDFMQSNYPHLTESELSRINDAYPIMDRLLQHEPYFPSASAAWGEASIVCSGLLLSDTMARFGDGSKVWNYRYNVQDPGSIALGLGVTHTSETSAVFGGLDMAPGLDTSLADVNAGIVPLMEDYYISFVVGMDPNKGKARETPVWQIYRRGPSDSRLRIMTNGTQMENVDSGLRDRCDMWKSMAGQMEF